MLAMYEFLGPLVLFSAAMCLTPGPNVVMIVASAANFGFRRSIAQMTGVTVGFAAEIAAAGLGLAGVFEAEPRLHAALKYAGAAYLLYLAWRIARADAAGAGSARTRPLTFLEGGLVTWLNPKGWVSAIGAIAAFTRPDGNLLPQVAVIVLVLAAACLISLALWAIFGVAISRLLTRPVMRRAFNGTMAVLLVLSLVPVMA